jgi:hypothetical protein
MRKISLLAAAAAICVSAPVLAKGGNNEGNGGGAGQGSGGSNGNSNGHGNSNGQGGGNSQGGGSGQGAGSGGGGNAGGAGLGNNQSQGNSGGLGNGGNAGGNSGNAGGNGGNAGGNGGNAGGNGGNAGGNGGNAGGNGGNAGGNGGNAGGNGGGNVSQPVACGLHDLSLAALACSGFYSGNLLDNNDVAAQIAGLALVGYSWDGDFNKLVDAGQKIDGNGATEIGFGKELTGLTVIGIHFGGGGPSGVGNGTAFYSFDAGAGVNTLGLNYPGSSGIVLYSTGHAVGPNPPLPPKNDTGSVPEPSSWALMIGGFGMVGSAMRRRKGVPAAA